MQPEPLTLNLQPSTLNLQPSTLNPKAELPDLASGLSMRRARLRTVMSPEREFWIDNLLALSLR